MDEEAVVVEAVEELQLVAAAVVDRGVCLVVVVWASVLLLAQLASGAVALASVRVRSGGLRSCVVRPKEPRQSAATR